MNRQIEQMISELPADEEVKESLRVTDQLLNPACGTARGSVFATLIVAGDGCGLSGYGRVYAAIVDASLSVKGTSTYLELVFPKDNERDELRFYASPRVAASIRNRFYGTMLISLREFSGPDLFGSESFRNLLAFIESNRGNIRFIFHVLPEFRTPDRLAAALREIVCVETVFLDKPGIEKGYAYVMDELAAQGVVIDEEARRCIREKALPGMVARMGYSGYRSLDAFLGRLSHESAMAARDGERRVDMSVMDRVMDRIGKEEETERNGPGRIGFNTGERR